MANVRPARDGPDNWADYCDQISIEAFVRTFVRNSAGSIDPVPNAAGISKTALRIETKIATQSFPTGWIPAERNPEIS